jgi:hypothetical protein
MINDLDPEQRSEYESLLNENKVLMNDINNMRMELDEVNQKLAIAENRLRVSPDKNNPSQLHNRWTLRSSKGRCLRSRSQNSSAKRVT